MRVSAAVQGPVFSALIHSVTASRHLHTGKVNGDEVKQVFAAGVLYLRNHLVRVHFSPVFTSPSLYFPHFCFLGYFCSDFQIPPLPRSGFALLSHALRKSPFAVYFPCLRFIFFPLRRSQLSLCSILDHDRSNLICQSSCVSEKRGMDLIPPSMTH